MTITHSWAMWYIKIIFPSDTFSCFFSQIHNMLFLMDDDFSILFLNSFLNSPSEINISFKTVKYIKISTFFFPLRKFYWNLPPACYNVNHFLLQDFHSGSFICASLFLRLTVLCKCFTFFDSQLLFRNKA